MKFLAILLTSLVLFTSEVPTPALTSTSYVNGGVIASNANYYTALSSTFSTLGDFLTWTYTYNLWGNVYCYWLSGSYSWVFIVRQDDISYFVGYENNTQKYPLDLDATSYAMYGLTQTEYEEQSLMLFYDDGSFAVYYEQAIMELGLYTTPTPTPTEEATPTPTVTNTPTPTEEVTATPTSLPGDYVTTTTFNTYKYLVVLLGVGLALMLLTRR